MNAVKKYLPFGILALTVLMLAGKYFGAPAAKVRGMNLYAAGCIPVQHGGRLQPADSVARNSLMIISGKQEVDEILPDKTEVTHRAMEWLLDVWAQPDKADRYRIFRIEHPEILNKLKLDERPGSYRYTWPEVSAHRSELKRDAAIAEKKHKDDRTLVDKKVLELSQHIQVYEEVAFRARPGFIPATGEEAKWTSYWDIIQAKMEQYYPAEQAKAAKAVEAEMSEQDSLIAILRKHIDPKALLDLRDDRDAASRILLQVRKWETSDRAMKAVRDKMHAELPMEYPVAADLEKILDAYKANDADAFNAAVAAYHERVSPTVPAESLSRVAVEARMNAFDPFLQCAALYIGVAVLAALSWLVWEKPLNRSAFYLACLTLAVHTGALAVRMYIGNRPPVTNLYSSAVFIGWGSLLLCLTLEGWYKNGVASFVGGAIGFSTVVIARFLAESGDTLEMLQAVLDTNLWLATHVTIVTLGYVATFVAGLIAFVYIGRGMFTNQLRGEEGRRISGMIYGVICFATLLSFTGTVLGGIWADQSWGRFWGWDPKENGAVLIVIWNSLILHARWGGLVKARGMAVLAVLGNMVCAWSWFGTNQLGIGLHAYGFDNRLATGCAVFWILNLMIAGLGMVPLRFWASFGPEPTKA
jgi:ABC-type transport system involved in cytochrome c biogenesis permease subunit